MSRKERQSQRERRRRDRQREAARKTSDDMAQAVVKRRDYLPSKNHGDIHFVGLSIGEQSEIKHQALRYFRRERLSAMIDDIEVMVERGLMNPDQRDRELNTFRQEVRQLTYSDLPPMKVVLGDQIREGVDYLQWYMAATVEGQIEAVLVSCRPRHPEMTRQDLKDMMREDPDWFIEASQIIMELTRSLIAKK